MRDIINMLEEELTSRGYCCVVGLQAMASISASKLGRQDDGYLIKVVVAVLWKRKPQWWTSGDI